MAEREVEKVVQRPSIEVRVQCAQEEHIGVAAPAGGRTAPRAHRGRCVEEQVELVRHHQQRQLLLLLLLLLLSSCRSFRRRRRIFEARVRLGVGLLVWVTRTEV